MMDLYKSYVQNCWYPVGLAAEFPTETLKGLTVCERPVVAWRTRHGDVVAFDDRCAHKRFPLSRGRLMPDGTLECAYHGLRYDMTGKCVMVPSQPNGPIPAPAATPQFPITEKDGVVWIWPGDPTKTHLRKPPRVMEIGDAAWETEGIGPTEISASYFLNIENVLDITHFYPLHDGNIGDLENSSLPVELGEGEEDGNQYCGTIRRAKNYTQPSYYVDWFHHEVADRYHTHFMISPGACRVELWNWPAGEEGNVEKKRGYVLYHLLYPVSPTKHVWRVSFNTLRGDTPRGAPDISTAKRIATMFPDVAKQDRWAIENQQRMVEHPVEGYQEVYLKADLAVRRARKIWHDLLRDESGIHHEAAE